MLNNTPIKDRLSRARKALDLSYGRLGALLRVAGPTIGNWCQGKTVPLGNNLEAVEAWLASVEPILDQRDQENPTG